MPTDPIYLDHNATSPLAPAAAEAMRHAWAAGFANPASQHGPGRAARRRLEACRTEILRLLGAEPAGRAPDRLVLTSGGTEANDLALRGMLAASGKRRIVISAIEHPSVARTADALESEGVEVDRLAVTRDGVVRIEPLAELLATAGDQIGLVSVMLASNETAVLQPIAQLATLCRESHVPLHTDAVQAVGKLPVGFRDLGVTALTFTAHKFHGPIGVGGLLLAPEARIEPRLWGGFQQDGLRPGTEATPLVAGAAAALRLAVDDMDQRAERLAGLRDRLEAALLASWPGAVALGAAADRSPHATCIAFRGGDRQALVMAYDLAGVACSSGSACASGSSQPSPTLIAMGLKPDLVDGAVRFAVGALTTRDDVETAISRLVEVNDRLQPTKTDMSATRS